MKRCEVGAAWPQGCAVLFNTLLSTTDFVCEIGGYQDATPGGLIAPGARFSERSICIEMF